MYVNVMKKINIFKKHFCLNLSQEKSRWRCCLKEDVRSKSHNSKRACSVTVSIVILLAVGDELKEGSRDSPFRSLSPRSRHVLRL